VLYLLADNLIVRFVQTVPRESTMQMITATDLKQHLGACFERVQAEPLIVARSGRPSAVLLSYETFQALKPLIDQLEDHYWGNEARQVKARGEFLRDVEAAEWVKSMEQRLEQMDATTGNR
jgi:prevent-host-death family protein